MLFLLVAMTYLNAMEQQKVLDALRVWLIKHEYHDFMGIKRFCINEVLSDTFAHQGDKKGAL